MTPLAVRSIGPDAVAVVGEIDASTADEFAAAVGSLGPHVTIDCGECDFIDSAGLTVLLALRTRVNREGGSVRLVNPSPAVRRLIEVSGLDGVFVVD